MPARLPVYTGQEEGWAFSRSLDYQELGEAPTGASCLREGVEPLWGKETGKGRRLGQCHEGGGSLPLVWLPPVSWPWAGPDAQL